MFRFTGETKISVRMICITKTAVTIEKLLVGELIFYYVNSVFKIIDDWQLGGNLQIGNGIALFCMLHKHMHTTRYTPKHDSCATLIRVWKWIEEVSWKQFLSTRASLEQ